MGSKEPVKKIVIADTGPLIALARIDQLALLNRLFGTVLITDAVALELTSGGVFPDGSAITLALAQPWLQMVATTRESTRACQDWINLHQIDMGEASALVMAMHQKSRGDEVLVIVDEARGRHAARHASLAVMGTAGLLLLTKRVGLISKVAPMLATLQQQGYYLSQRLIDAVLQQAGEVDD